MGRLDTETLSAFTRDVVLPRVETYDRDGEMPEDVLKAASEIGLWASFLPVRYGGSAVDWTTLGAVHREIGRACCSLRSILTAHDMVAESIMRWGTDDQRQRWLPALAGGLPSAFCLTGAESGSSADVSGTTARRDPDSGDWTITGAKRWTTMGRCAKLIMVFCDTGNGMTAFLVPRETEGVSSWPIEDMLGARANMLGEVRFDHVQVGPDAVLGPVGMAAGSVMTHALALGRYSVACGSVGLMQCCLDASAGYTANRSVADGALAGRQLVQQMITDMVTKITAGDLLCAEVGRLRDARDPRSILAGWVAKYFTSTASVAVAHDAVQLHGAAGCTPDHPVARCYRDAKLLEIIEGTNELQRETIARLAYRGVAR
jgi:alkylation response protein AidB-like acyl-CoA dehydrogenase